LDQNGRDRLGSVFSGFRTRIVVVQNGVARGEERPVPTDEELERTPPLPLVVWAARCSAYFLALGGIMLVSFFFYGFDTDPASFPPGFRLNPLQAGVNFV